jgi:flagellar basal body rod protein FlgG
MAINSVLTTAVNGLHRTSQSVQETATKIAGVNATPAAASSTPQQAALTGNTAITAQLSGAGDVSLVREFANLIEAKAAYSANLQVIRTADDLSKLSQDILT